MIDSSRPEHLSRTLQLAWALQNRKRLSPNLNALESAPSYLDSLLDLKWKADLTAEAEFARIEGEWIESERREIAPWANQAPRTPDDFIQWFEDLKQTGPGQQDPLFPWLAKEASFEEMRWFLKQEVGGEAGFDDLVALTQVKLPNQAKLELARNYWDEMGRGSERGMHGPMLHHLAVELELHPVPEAEIVTESLALGNLMVGMAFHKRYTYQSIGALGVIELTAPGRASCVYEGLKRLDVSSTGRQYYLLHSTLDVKHSEAWNREVLRPLISASPKVAPLIAEGALLRLKAGSFCFRRYRRELDLLNLNSKIASLRLTA
ncbi:MAG: iron-containing redox enzyme family protein [Methylotenera sp.]|nr:iron-containing redox enzyme family protein [Oligoflexia bacterium]